MLIIISGKILSFRFLFFKKNELSVLLLFLIGPDGGYSCD